MLLTDRRYWPLFWTQFFGAFNDNFFKNALVILITYEIINVSQVDTALMLPASGLIFILPFFLFSATAGQMADKFQKAKMIRATKVTEILVMSLAAVGFYSDSVILLLVVLFLMGAQSAFFGPLKYGIIPSLVEQDELVSATGIISSGTFVAILGGTILGGLLAGMENFAFILTCGVIGFGILGLIPSFYINDVPIFEEETKVDYTFVKPTWDILRYTMRDREIFRTVIGISWFWFLGSAILANLTLIAKDILWADSKVGTVFLAIFVVGMVLGSIITKLVSGETVEIGLVPISAVGMSLFMADMFLVGFGWPSPIDAGVPLSTFNQFITYDNSIRFMFDLLMVATFGGSYIVPQMTYIQEISDKSEVSRSIAGNNIWNALFMVSAGAVMMVLNKSVGILNAILVIAALNFAMSFVLYYWHSLRTVRFWGWIISHTLYRLEIRGVENVPKEGSFIIASNHVSFIDWLLIYAAIKRPVRFVIDWNYYYVTWGPFWFKQAKLVPIAPKKESEEVLKKAWDHISEHIAEGAILGIFPEGWLTRDGELRPFQPGVQKIVARDPVPIVLCGIDGLWGSIFSWEGGKVIWKFPKSFRKKVTVTFSEPINPGEYNSKVAEKIIRSYVSHYGDAHEEHDREVPDQTQKGEA